jgi:murein DD-endopeptidase MepM/ murein hydrolase activator NlpD
VFTRLAFPHFSKAIGDKVTTIFDYRAAITALGEGLSGERKFTEALGQAWTVAFHPGQGTVDVAGTLPEETPVAATITPPLPTGDIAGDGTEDKADGFAPIDPASAGVSTAAAEFSDAVSAFIETQKEYESYGIPAGVSYEMPPVGEELQSPTDGVVTSRFGYRNRSGNVCFHYGTDIAAPRGTPVCAVLGGTVERRGESESFGKYIVISHADGVSTMYAHCEKILPKTGEHVAAGEKIAEMGDTGNATNVCLHFELKIGGVNVNPEYYIKWA